MKKSILVSFYYWRRIRSHRLLLLFYLALPLLFSASTWTIVVGCLMGYYLLTYFGLGIGKQELLATMLPLSRAQVVRGAYLFSGTLLAGLVAAAVSINCLVAPLLPDELNTVPIGATTGLLLFSGALTTAVVLPLALGAGSLIAQAIANGFFFAVIFGMNGAIDLVAQRFDASGVGLLLYPGSVLLLVVSYAVTQRMYKDRQFLT